LLGHLCASGGRDSVGEFSLTPPLAA
jgi:hypothetical protein